MSRVCLLVFALFVSMSVNAKAHLIQGIENAPITTKEVLIPHEDKVEAVTNVVDEPADEVKANDVDLHDRVGAEPLEKECVPIGQFCMYHSDCCTNACLGYLKKCVS